MHKIVHLALGIALIFTTSACKRNPNTTGNPVLRNVMDIELASCQLNQPFSAVIESNNDVEIRPRVTGYIFKQHVDEGDFVKAGQLLFTIDPIQMQAEMEVAEANVEAAKAEVETALLTYNTKTELFEKEIISANDLQMAKNALASAKATLSQKEAALVNAQRNLEFCNITSPVDGIVGVIAYTPGNLVSSSSTRPLTTVTDISTMRCYFSISEREALSLSRRYGSPQDIVESLPPVKLKLVDGSMYPHEGKVITVSGVPDEQTGAIRIRADFPNPEQMLKSKFSGTILIPTQVDSAIVIPQKATYEVQSKTFVYVVSDSNTVHAREVKMMPLNDGINYVITEGLKAHDRIVTDGVNFLKEGDLITPKN